MPMLADAIAVFCLGWYFTLQAVIAVGCIQLYKYYRRTPRRAISETLPLHDVPHITIIRPLKGLEPYLYECLTATFRLTYPREKLTVFFCIASRSDPAFAIATHVIQDFPQFDAQVLVEEEDEHLQGQPRALGPNPKIRNMSRAYREAKGDLIWIIDCNVWVGKGVAGRLVDTIEGLGRNSQAKKYKLVHQLPLVVDVTSSKQGFLDKHGQGSGPQAASTSTSATSVMHSSAAAESSSISFASSFLGGRLEELFLASSHAKMYTSINTVLLAPCIVGKSNMFRRSHLNALTKDSPDFRPQGIDYFSYNICEDHLIGDLLWKQDVPEEIETGQKLGKHAMVFGDLAIQPMAGMSTSEYIARRARWLRVRKFTVTAATLVEPGTESILSSIFLAHGLTASSWVQQHTGVSQSWTTFVAIWLSSMAIWTAVDRWVYLILHSMSSVEQDEDTPDFARSHSNSQRIFKEWFLAWLGRETLALPIWIWAVWGGVTVQWRGNKFRVGMDMRVHALESDHSVSAQGPFPGPSRSLSRTPDQSKARQE